MAKAIADTVTEHDWAALLNRLSTDRAARQIARRPAEEGQFLEASRFCGVGEVEVLG